MVASLLLVLSIAGAPLAHAHDTRYDVTIDEQPIGGALKSLAAQTGLQVLVFSLDAAQKRSPAVRGNLTNNEALVRILDDTGLTYEKIDNNTVAVRTAALQEPQEGNPRSSDLQPENSAQEHGGDQKRSAMLEEIVVTATKRGAQDLQAAPVTVTAFTGEVLQNRGIDNITDLSANTAGLDLQKVAPGQTQVIIRGVSLGSVISGTTQNRATTGLYLNDVSFEQNGMNPDPDLFDLERVEVLKGPQGSLFGSSAMAGAIRYVTKRPDLNAVSARAVADGSQTQQGNSSYAAKGVVNIPLVDGMLATRVMAYRNDNGGWINNAYTDRSDVNTDEQTGARLSTLWQPTDTISGHLMLQYQDMKVVGLPKAQQGSSTLYGPSNLTPEDLTIFVNGDASWSDEFLLSTLEFNWNLGNITLTSVSGYIDRNFKNSRPGDMWEFLMRLGADLPNPQFNDPYESNKFSQELRVTSKLGDLIGLTGGLYFSDADISYSSYMSEQGWDQFLIDVFFDDFNYGCQPNYPDHVFCGRQSNNERQLAAYGEVDFHLTQRLTFTAGGRWFNYDQHFDEHYAGYFNGGRTDKTQKFSDDGFNPKFGVSYNIEDSLLLFASAAKGFRMGGVDDPIPSLCDEELATLGLSNYQGVYKSDSLWTYELGAKSTLFDRRVTLNGSVFDTEWEDIQTGTTLECGYRVTQNATKQRIQGVEVSTRLAVTGDFGVELNGSYTDSHLVGDAPAIRGRDGDRAPYTPRVTVNGTFDYQHAVTNYVDGFALLSFNYRSDSYNEYNREIRMPSQLGINLRLGLESSRYKTTLYVNNLTDRLLLSYANVGHGGDVQWHTGRPRTIGIELQADFQ